MKYTILKFSLLLVLSIVTVEFVISQETSSFEAITSIAVDTFDDGTTGWTLRASKEIDESFLDSRIVNAWPRALYGESPSEERNALGIRGGFRRQGYNFIEIIPPGGVAILPGIVKDIELWVWNSNRDYYITAQIQDSFGLFHTIELGSINHIGWKKLSARIPSVVIQKRQQLQDSDRIRLLKLIVWTKPSSNVNEFQVYLDELRIITDTYQGYIDGGDLSDPDRIEQIWG